jgi:hypothetical protein
MINLINYIDRKIKITHVILIWLSVNFLSAFFTQLYADEAYYTLYAKHLAFGYFDHPPMIALMIRMGLYLFNNEFGVRLFSVISITIALYLIYELAEVNKPLRYLIMILSVFGLNILGFLALPDSPLLLFAVLFFVVYRNFLRNESIVYALLLGLTISAMLYSKYHGLLIIIFTLMSNRKIIRSPRFYLAAFLALILYVPYIVWLFDNNFISITYHLFERSANHYNSSFTLGYLLGQVLYYGPLSGVVLFYSASKSGTSDLFEKSLKWNLWGFMSFFLLASFKGRIEVNWTFLIIIPLFYFFLKYNFARPEFEKWFYILTFPIILAILLLRIEVAYPILNLQVDRLNDFRGHREFGREIISKCDGLPLITNNYQRAGIVSFYTKTFAPSINVNGRRNQFNLWHYDDSLRFKKVVYVNNYLDEGVKIQNPLYKGYKLTIIDSLPVMNDIIISTGVRRLVAGPAEKMKVKVVLISEKKPESYRDAGKYRTRLQASLYEGENLLTTETCSLPIDCLLKNEKGEYNFWFTSPEQKGRYKISVSLMTSEIGIWSTRKTVWLTVK